MRTPRSSPRHARLTSRTSTLSPSHRSICQVNLGVDRREIAQRQRLLRARSGLGPPALSRRRRHQEGTQIERGSAQGAADARTRPAEGKTEVSGKVGLAQPAMQIADMHRVGGDCDRATHRRAAEFRQRRADQPLDRSEILGAGFDLHACRALTHVDCAVGMQPCTLRADLDSERPVLGIVLKQPHRPAFDSDCKIATRLQAAARGEAQGSIPAGADGQVIQFHGAAHCRARVVVVNVEPLQHDAGDVDRGLPWTGVGSWRRGPVARPIGASFEPQVDTACLDAA